jgi:hypothetical protein
MRQKILLPMKKLILASLLTLITLACLTAAPTPSAVDVETAVARTLTAATQDEPPRLYLPGIATLPPPAVGAPTQMATSTTVPSPTSLFITVAALPTVQPTVNTAVPAAPTAVPSLSADQRSITYLVTGDAVVVKIYFTNQDGATETDLFSLPFERTIVVKQGAALELLAENMGDTGTVICTITSGEKVLKNSSASGPRQIAGCIDAIAE